MAPKFNPRKDLEDLKGKVAIVTGGNRGIGLYTVLHLARAGAKVYLAARDEKKANDAIAQLKKEGLETGEVVWLKLDLSNPRDAKSSAEEFLSKEQRLDILVNNGGLNGSYTDFVRTSDGPSLVVTVNYISPFVFTETLLPIMTSTALSGSDTDVRITNVSSAGHSFTPDPISFRGVDDFCVEYKGKIAAGFLRYCHSKLLDILWTKNLQKRLSAASPAVPITVTAIHPGTVDTFSDRLPLRFITKPLLSPFLISPERGAHTSAFAAAGTTIKKEKEKYKGVYLDNSPVGKITKPSAAASNETAAEELYDLTKKFLSGIGL